MILLIKIREINLKYLKDNNLINEKYSNIFEMETLRANNNINSGNNININNNKFIQTYKLKEKNDKNRNSNFEVDQLFLAKELGLDNSLFLRSLEIENLFKKKQKIFPDLEKFMKYTHSLEKNKKDIYDKIMEYTQNNISLESDEKEINLIKYLADKFN